MNQNEDFINESNIQEEDYDFREYKTIILREDAKDIKVDIIGNDTFINYTSESHPNDHMIELVSGHWDKISLIDVILTLKEQ